MRSFSLSRRSKIIPKNILISLDGTNKNNITLKVIESIGSLIQAPKVNTVIVLGQNVNSLSEVGLAAGRLNCNTKVIIGSNNMAKLLSNCDLAIGAGGTFTWERCCLGVPSILFVLAENQQDIAIGMQKVGAAKVAFSISKITQHLEYLLSDGEGFSNKLAKMADISKTIVDGLGLERVVNELML